MRNTAPPALSNLAELIDVRPPLLTEITAALRHTEDYSWFRQLVERIMPEDAEAIFGQDTL
ncbi:MAG: hypothetical protein OXC95_18595, partial [Dehalococcoidia bacterium]|nr:hypothetical protein [Dehalococcoidia bacterium]